MEKLRKMFEEFNKKRDILKLYHSDEKLPKYKRREKRYDDQTECLAYLGPHPKVMKDRIIRLGESFEAPVQEKIYIVDKKEKYSKTIVSKIRAKEVVWVDTLSEVPKPERKNAVLVHPSFFQKLLHASQVPSKMKSPLAREWNRDFVLTLRLSEKSIGLS